MEKSKIIYLNASDGTFTICDDASKEITLDEAKSLWETGQIKDSNLSFQRLANMNFDITALKQFYNDNP